MRYLINTICIALLLWGCDNATAVPAKPIVVSKKIVTPKDNTVKVSTDKTVRTAKMKPDVKLQQTKTVVAKFDKTQAKAKNQPTVKADANSRPLLIVKKIVTKPVDNEQPDSIKQKNPAISTKAVVAKFDKTQAKAKNQPTVKEDADSRLLIASKQPIDNLLPDSVKQKKPAISPKSEITDIKPLVKSGRAGTVAGDKPKASQPVAASNSLSDGPPIYDATGKIDPFEPLFREKQVVAKKSNKKIKRIPRTPLERIDLSQLKLVGIIVASSGNRALVEESTGKGYVIKAGTYIGTNGGKIVKIKKETVYVEERFEDVYGKIQTRNRELKLPKPPGEF
jgi:type IV pilus assembly protein PilP